MPKLNTRENFIQVLVECKGYSIGEAEEEAEEYHNNLENYLTDIGCDDNQIREAKIYCGIV